MSSPKLKQHTFGDLPTVRSVFRQGDKFICGLCRKNYPTQRHAIGCLNNCWLKIGQMDPTVPVIKRRKLRGHKCRYCSRIYQHLDEATECAFDCRSQRKERHQNDLQMLEMKPEELNKKAFEFQSFTQAPVNTEVFSRVKWTTKEESEEENPQTPETGEEETQETQEEPLEEGEQLPVEEDTRQKKSDFQKPVVRKDEKYQCSFCKELYFTKMETEQCFNGHFDEEGFEKTQGSAEEPEGDPVV